MWDFAENLGEFLSRFQSERFGDSNGHRQKITKVVRSRRHKRNSDDDMISGIHDREIFFCVNRRSYKEKGSAVYEKFLLPPRRRPVGFVRNAFTSPMRDEQTPQDVMSPVMSFLFG